MFGQLDSVELRTGLTLAGVIAFRMLGLFMILPVFMLLAADMPGFSPAKAGLAVGIYGLTQAALQQPFGKLSDRFGRRPVMLAGLALFAAGGVVAALADSIEMMIAGRALQGCGAIAGVALAFAADHTRVQNRSVIMAIIGMGIGASFLLSMMISVPLSTLLGLRGLFWLTATLGVLGMLLVLSLPKGHVTREEHLQESGRSATIWLFALSVFLLHAVMTLLFVVLPGMLVSQFGFELEYHWRIYVPSMLGSVILVFPLLRRITASKQEKRAMPLAFLVLGGALGLMSLGQSLICNDGVCDGFLPGVQPAGSGDAIGGQPVERNGRSRPENGFVHDIPVSGCICGWIVWRLVAGFEWCRGDFECSGIALYIVGRGHAFMVEVRR